MAKPSTILIAHKDPLARAYLRGVVERTHSMSVFREATSFNDVVDALTREPVTRLALIDIELPGMASDLGLRFFATHFRQSRFVALYSALAIDRVARLAESGVVGCVPKDLSETALVRAFKTIFDGHPYTPPGCAIAADRTAPADAPAPALIDHELTGRQSEVLRLLAQGRSNREIGQMLNIAEGTVKVHVNAAFRVLGVHNRVSAAAAIRKRLEEPHLDVRQPSPRIDQSL